MSTRRFPVLLSCVVAGLGLYGCHEGGSSPSPVDPAASSVAIEPQAGVVADGMSEAVIRITLRDAKGKALSGRLAEVSATGTSNGLVQPPPTDAAGETEARLASTVAEVKILTVRAGEGPELAEDAVVLDDQPGVAFVGDAGNLSASLSTLTASALEGITADGLEVVELTVTVRDALGNPVAGQVVELTVSEVGEAPELSAVGEEFVLTQPAGPTDAAGRAVGTLASTLAGELSVGFVINPGPGVIEGAAELELEFVGDPTTITPELSEAVADPPGGVIADGVQSALIHVTVRDTFGNPVEGQTVQLTAGGGASFLTQPPGPTDAAGVATGALASTLAETVAVEVRINPGPEELLLPCLLYTSPSPRDQRGSRMPSSA